VIEAGWACLLILASLDKRTRPLALLLAVKWGLCYGAALSGWWTVPAYIDLIAAAFAAVMVKRLPHPVEAVLLSCFVAAPLVHAWHWSLWAHGVYVGMQYWAVMLGLFSAQTLALAWPGGRNLVLALVHSYRLGRRRAVAGSYVAARQGQPTAAPAP